MSKELHNSDKGFDVRYIADLAMLSLNDDEIEMYEKELGEIVNFADSIKEAHIDNTDFNYDNSITNAFREDIAEKKFSRCEMLDSVSISDGEFVIVPNVVEE